MHKICLLVIMTLISINTSFSQTNLSLIGQLPYVSSLSDVWGYVDSAGTEYALVGTHNGLSIVDLSDPSTPVEVQNIPGPPSTWRETRTWGNYAYGIHDVVSGGVVPGVGLLIVDLSNLPNSVDTTLWTVVVGTDTLRRAHSMHIDENGYAYLFGSNVLGGGALILDLSNPTNPTHVGTYDEGYIHDGFVRGDTLWAAEVKNGHFAVIDVSNKANPSILATQNTPDNFTHNCWPSDDGKYLFTTDEKSSAYIGSFKVDDLSNIEEADRYRSSHSTGVIPHNTFFIDNFLVTSYYTDGVIIVDATCPGNLVETGNYD
ncbi:MAG: choice-of-anchor B family protein, partial [Bacteroidetes bacterium]|nr:choice-of-anchor B family protein [Bacteroidota bacterium]